MCRLNSRFNNIIVFPRLFAILQKHRPTVRRVVVHVFERVLLALVPTDRRHVLQDGLAKGKTRCRELCILLPRLRLLTLLLIN